MDRRAWWATVHGVTKSWARLKRLSMHAHMPIERHTCYFAKIWLYCFQGEYIVSFLPLSLSPSLPLSLSSSLSFSLSFFLSSRFNPKVGKIPWRREQQCTPVFLPENFHGQSSLVGYPQSMGPQRVSALLILLVMPIVLLFTLLALLTESE